MKEHKVFNLKTLLIVYIIGLIIAVANLFINNNMLEHILQTWIFVIMTWATLCFTVTTDINGGFKDDK